MSNSMTAALGRMADCCRYFVYLLDWDAARGKFTKKPMGSPAAACMTYAQAHAEAMRQRGNGQGATVGLWIARDSGLFFVDIDSLPGDFTPDARATELLAMFPGAFVEWSSGRKGLHIVGTLAQPVEHSSRNEPLHLEFYTAERGIALNIDAQPTGSMDTVHDVGVLVARYFPPRALSDGMVRPEWRGPADDDELIRRALAARESAAVVLGGKASFAQLWRGEVEPNSEHDAALAAHLAFWTGCDAARIDRLMWRSGMVRDKWREHRTYLETTIAKACAIATNVYHESMAAAEELGTASATSELSNAHRLHKLHGADLLAVQGIGWHVWPQGGPWRFHPPTVHRLAYALGQAIQAEADAMQAWVDDETVAGSDEADRRAELQRNRQRWAKASEGRTVITNSLALLESYLTCEAETLDADPLLVGCPSGVIDLATCGVREHRREDRITKVIACDYDPAARAPTWQRFIGEVFGNDAELIRYVQTLCGYILSGKRGHHLLPVFYGTGANGKSTFLSTLQALLGDYAGTAPAGLLVATGGNEHPTGIASLKGRRLVIVSETGEGGRLAESQIKMLTGGDRITARLMRQDFFSFDPTHLLILQTNHKPRVTGTDEGIWRRVKLVPFTVTIPPERRDPDLAMKLLAELPGVLTWVVEGWRMYQRDGFKEPQAVRAATAEYRSDSDHVGTFLSERCIVGPQHTCTSAQLYQAYKQWCDEAGERALSQRTFGVRLGEREGLEQVKATGGTRTWRGLSVDHAAPLRIVTPAAVIPLVK